MTDPYVIDEAYSVSRHESSRDKLANLRKQIEEVRGQLDDIETTTTVNGVLVSYTGNGGTSKTSRYKDLLLKIVDALDEKGCKMLIEAYAEGSSEE